MGDHHQTLLEIETYTQLTAFRYCLIPNIMPNFFLYDIELEDILV